MSRTELVLYRDGDEVPLRDWLDALPDKARIKCLARLERLEELGHELRRPEADLLRHGIHELRASLGGVHYRMPYFFHGRTMVVVSHGLTKERAVPAKEIERALERKRIFTENPREHSFRGEIE